MEEHMVHQFAAVYDAYSKATGRYVSTPITEEEARQVRDWLIEEELSGDGSSIPLLWMKESYLKPVVSPDLASKVGWLQQAHCHTCRPANTLPLALNLSIRVRPFSAQAAGKKLAKLKILIKKDLVDRAVDLSGWKGYPLCVTIVVILPSSDRLKDVDNLAKGLLDSMQDAIYENDRLIQHVSIHRVLHDGPEGWYKVQVMPTVDTRENVVDKSLRVSWAGRPEIIVGV